MDFLKDPWTLATGAGIAIALHVLGVKALVPKTGRSKAALWTAFVVEAVCGLVLGAALFRVTQWLTGLVGRGPVLGSIGAIIALAIGWQAIKKLVAMVRDIADGTPDADARSAALWVPTLLPSGWGAVANLMANPRGIGTGIVAAIMAGITLGYCLSIVKEMEKAQRGDKAWKWAAVAMCTFTGIVLIGAVVYIDEILSQHLPSGAMLALRGIGAAAGAGLAVAAVADIADRVPDKHVRRFAMYGLPLLYLFGSLLISLLGTNVSSGLDLMTGSMQ